MLNKADQIPASDFQKLQDELRNQFPNTPLLSMSALHGQGIPKWLESVRQRTPAGQKIVDVDYDTYAQGEAVLGRPNATASLSPKEAIDWGGIGAGVPGGFTPELLQQVCRNRPHENADGLCEQPIVERGSDKFTGESNLARSDLRGISDDSGFQRPSSDVLGRTAGHNRGAPRCRKRGTIHLQITAIQSLSPGRPQPLHRYATVV